MDNQNNEISLIGGGLAIAVGMLAAMVTIDVYNFTKGKVSDLLEKRGMEDDSELYIPEVDQFLILGRKHERYIESIERAFERASWEIRPLLGDSE